MPPTPFGVVNATKWCWWQRTATGQWLRSGPVRGVSPEVDRKAFPRLFPWGCRDFQKAVLGDDSDQHPCAVTAFCGLLARRGYFRPRCIRCQKKKKALLEFEPTLKAIRQTMLHNPLATSPLLSHCVSRHLSVLTAFELGVWADAFYSARSRLKWLPCARQGLPVSAPAKSARATHNRSSAPSPTSDSRPRPRSTPFVTAAISPIVLTS